MSALASPQRYNTLPRAVQGSCRGRKGADASGGMNTASLFLCASSDAFTDSSYISAPINQHIMNATLLLVPTAFCARWWLAGPLALVVCTPWGTACGTAA